MENQNQNKPFNYLPVVLLLAVAVVAGLTFSSLRNAGSANLLATETSGVTTTDCDKLASMMQTGGYTAEDKEYYYKYCVQVPPTTTDDPQYNCDDIKKKMDAGSYTSEEKEWYAKYCTTQPPQPSSDDDVCEKLKKLMDSGNYTYEEKQQYLKLCTKPETDDQKPTDDPCQYLKDLMAKYADQPNSEEYMGAKKKFVLYCEKPDQDTNVCSDLKMKLETLIKNGETDTDEYAKIKLTFTDLCTDTTPFNDRCAELKTKLETYIQNGDTNSEGYASVKAEFLKSCQKPLPPAGYEDEIDDTYDQEDCPFSDVKVEELCGKAATELYRRGVIGGFSDGTFRGSDLVNRAQAAKFLLLARFGIVGDDDGDAGFKDVPKGQWYTRFVLKASKLGVIRGYGDGSFKPGNTVNTAEFLKMLSLTFELETGLGFKYEDVSSTDWFAQYAGLAEKYNLFPDRTGGKLEPARKLTRCEVAVAIYQFLKNRGV